jgi:LacI family transcriptional regulator
MQRKRVLLKDIAERANLTVNTVSRALKNKSDISLATREYIQSLALEMGYIPDVVAASLRNGYTNTIGVMFDNLSNPYYMIMTDYIDRFLKDNGYDIMIFTSYGVHSEFDIETLNKMISRRIDGIITFLRPTDEVAKVATLNKIPLVVLGREADDIGIDSVYTDDVNGGYEVAKHLVGLGHEKIGYLGASIDIMCSKKRAEGLVKYLKETGRILPKENIYFQTANNPSIIKPLKKFVELGITAIFCLRQIMTTILFTIQLLLTWGTIHFTNIMTMLKLLMVQKDLKVMS